ncbi:MAG: hypothetical protein KJ042_15400, partial [Deltaproteobacteria bacterium]|nr:hypothetical protein [Deltaproteobacteria bacterium]
MHAHPRICVALCLFALVVGAGCDLIDDIEEELFGDDDKPDKKDKGPYRDLGAAVLGSYAVTVDPYDGSVE